MTLNNKSKENIIAESTKLIQKYGYAETSIQDIIKKSKSPKGSLYYYFPKGKDDIVLSALDNIDLEFSKKFKSSVAKCTELEEVLEKILDLFKYKERVYGTPSFRLTLLALETIGQAPEVYNKCGEIIKSWKTQLSYKLEDIGYEYNLSNKITEWFFTTLQGAVCASVIHDSITNMQIVDQAIKLIKSKTPEELETIFL